MSPEMNNINSFPAPQQIPTPGGKEPFATAITFFEKIGMPKLVENPEARKEFIKKMTFEDFKSLITRTNGILREIPNSKTRKFDGESVAVIDKNTSELLHIPPYHGDKELLLEEAFNALKRMNKNNAQGQDSGAMMLCAIHEIHPFNDGNGRTSRATYAFLASPNADPNIFNTNIIEFNNAIEEQVEEKVFRLPPYVNESIKIVDDYKSPTSGEIPDDAGEREYFANSLKYDQRVMMNAIKFYCKDSATDYKKMLLSPDNTFSFESFFNRIKPSELEGIVDAYRMFKKQFVRTSIDMFEHPENYSLDKNMPRNFIGKEGYTDIPAGASVKDIFFRSEHNSPLKESNSAWENFLSVLKAEPLRETLNENSDD